MSATKTTRKQAAAKSAPKGRQAKQKQEADPQALHNAAISAGMKELAGVRTAARAKRNGTPAKPMIFDIWFKNVGGFDVDAVAKKFPEVKPSSIRAWVAYWKSNSGVGPGYPSNARGKEKLIKAALKKAGIA